ncbi:Membrane-bound lytic murein transglycosylase D precursor (EC [Olavius sp. associated proteobacterium Delta 1]|nr:Membrane-bound lytic murein transglycosylase D precursor (EC [Olavius sp. associated proteobacterium Delta 1]
MQYNKLILCFVTLASITLSAMHGDSSETMRPAQFPALISSVHVSGPLDFCGEIVELDNPEVRERLEKELLLTLWDRPQIVLWIKRSKRFFPIIEKMLQEHNMPQDLKYIVIIESALRPHAGSRKGAIGFWQFMEATGRRYGLVINSEKDERRNIFRSTEAAISYYKELYELLKSWTLSAAAYNMGEQGLQSEILAQKSNNYYHLYLPLETQRYIMRAISAKIILSAPEAYGFRFTEADLYPPLQFDRIRLECFQETPIAIIAQAADTYFKMIKDLNPEIRGHYLAAGSHWLLIPRGAADGFHTRFKVLVNQWLAESSERVYVVKAGDNLSAIAERFNVPLPALIIWNRLAKNKHIHPGDRLVIYSDAIELEEGKAGE